jgi:undecaprenyl-diphosphatase
MTPDSLILTWFHIDMASGLSDILFQWFSSRYLFSIPILMGLLFYAAQRQGWHGVFWWFSLIVVVALGDLFGNILKELFSELRPCASQDILQDLRTNLICGDSTKGMPSNHAINFFTATLFLILTRPQWRTWHLIFLVCSILASLSRIYLAKHFPSQVIAGSFIGVYVGTLTALIYHHRIWLGTLLQNIKPFLQKEL